MIYPILTVIDVFDVVAGGHVDLSRCLAPHTNLYGGDDIRSPATLDLYPI